MTDAEKAAIAAAEARTKQIAEEALAPTKAIVDKMVDEAKKNNGGVTDETFSAYKKECDAAVERVKNELSSIQHELLALKTSGGAAGGPKKGLAELMHEDADRLKQIADDNVGIKRYMMTVDENNKVVFSRVADGKAEKSGTMGTVGGIGNIANTSSISSALTSSLVMRALGPQATVYSQYRNNPWLFDLCNTNTLSENSMFAFWINELAATGVPGAVKAEGTTKQMRKFNYELKGAEYKTAAMLLSFTEEFGKWDFGYLEQRAISTGLTELINTVNTEILPRVRIAATDFANQNNAYQAPNPKGKWDAIAAMAAMSEEATFGGAMTNAAVMGTKSYYELGTDKTTDGLWRNSPDVLRNIGLVRNPQMGADEVWVGDFKQYNIDLRGGVIIKVGYNGTDFAENKYSVVLEQRYFDYISDNRRPAIVKGPDFANVIALI